MNAILGEKLAHVFGQKICRVKIKGRPKCLRILTGIVGGGSIGGHGERGGDVEEW